MGKIVIAGGSGFLGSYLTDSLVKKGHEIIILTRSPKKSTNPHIRFTQWDGKNPGEWNDDLENSIAIINLSGSSINTRFTKKNKQKLTSSRINPTLAIGNSIIKSKNPPKVWINASGAGIYGDGGDQPKTENSKPGKGFVSDLCVKWEKVFFEFETPQTRKVALRTSLVLSKKGGAVKPLYFLTKFGLGGKAGNGKQYLPWIHYKDWVRMVEWICREPSISGPVNIAAPQEVTNKSFMRELRKAVKAPFGLPQPSIFIKIGAFFMGTEPQLVLNSQRVVPKIAIDSNFKYNFPDLKSAFSDLFKKDT